jgi:zona occludens toxin
MAIFAIVGRPGAGKSYEAVRQWAFEAYKAERRVITNLPLNLDVWQMFFPTHDAETLLDLRHEPDAFSRPEHYGDHWSHPGLSPGHGSFTSRHGKEGVGPLYIIDECHKALPARSTERGVIEWFKEHRHEGSDVVLLTQEPRDISRSILALVQCTYWTRNQSTAGYSGAYSVTVRDGWQKNASRIGGDLPRRYDPKYFPLYQSYSKGGTPGAETKVEVRPIHKRWWVKVAAAGLAFGAYQLYEGVSGLTDMSEPVQAATQPLADWTIPNDFVPEVPGAIPAKPAKIEVVETVRATTHPLQGKYIKTMFSVGVDGGPVATYVNVEGRKTPLSHVLRQGYTVEMDRWGDFLLMHEGTGRAWSVVSGQGWVLLD